MNCEKISEYFVDYIENNLNEAEHEMVSAHLGECSECREEVLKLRSIIGELENDAEKIDVPVDFTKRLRERVKQTKPIVHRARRKSMRVILVVAAILVLTMMTVLASTDSFFDLIKRLSPEERVTNIVDKGFGNRLNLSAVDKDVKITVTDVVADDIQTLILYKVEDLNTGKEYYPSFKDGIEVKERWGRVGIETKENMYNSVYNYQGKGTLTLYPIDTEEKTIHLSFNKLELNSKESVEILEGSWNFEIPIKKYHGKTYSINKSLKLGDYTVRFKQIIVAPTQTVLTYDCMGAETGKNADKPDELVVIEEINGVDLIMTANGKEYGNYNFGLGSWAPYSPIGGDSNKMTFESMFFDNPKSIEIKVKRLLTSAKDDKEFIIDLNSPKPQEFEYLGSKIKVDNIKIDENITFNVKEDITGRKYGSITYSLEPEGFNEERHFSGYGNYEEVLFVDRDGNTYDYYEGLAKWKEIREKDAVLYVTNTFWTLKPSEKLDLKGMNSIKMVIGGYSKTKFVNESLKVRLR